MRDKFLTEYFSKYPDKPEAAMYDYAMTFMHTMARTTLNPVLHEQVATTLCNGIKYALMMKAKRNAEILLTASQAAMEEAEKFERSLEVVDNKEGLIDG